MYSITELHLVVNKFICCSQRFRKNHIVGKRDGKSCVPEGSEDPGVGIPSEL